MDMERRTKETPQRLHVTISRCFNCCHCLHRMSVREVATGSPDTRRTEDIHSCTNEGFQRRICRMCSRAQLIAPCSRWQPNDVLCSYETRFSSFVGNRSLNIVVRATADFWPSPKEEAGRRFAPTSPCVGSACTSSD